MQAAARLAATKERNEPQGFEGFLKGGVTVTENNSNRSLSIPYPLLSVIVGLIVWLAGATIGGVYGVASLSANVSAMNNAMLIRDTQAAREREEDRKTNEDERRRLQGKIDELEAYYNQTRVEMARMQSQQRSR